MLRKIFSLVSSHQPDQQIAYRSPAPAEESGACSCLRRGLRLQLHGASLTMLLILGLFLPACLQAAQDEVKVLRARATTFWEARVKGDWATIFDYLSAEERKGGTKEQYVQFTKDKGPFRYLSYKLGDVDVDGDVGWVKTTYDMEPMQFPGLPPHHMDTVQLWEKRDGNWYPIPKDRQEDVPRLPPRLRPLKEENAVMARANEFWQAREKGDYGTVYQFCAPAFREKVAKEEFLSKKALNIYVGHQILFAEVAGDRAKVKATIAYRPNDPSLTKIDPAEETVMQEWIKVKDQWYLDVKEPG